MKKNILVFSVLILLPACALFGPVKVIDFDSCAKAKNPVLESSPRQCRTADGQIYVEQTDIPIWVLPDSELPASGICASASETDVVRVELNQDVPSPRCQKINRGQRLLIKNNTDEPVLTWFGQNQQYLFNIPAQSEYEVSQSVSLLLAPGVHILYGSPYQGPEIWVNN